MANSTMTAKQTKKLALIFLALKEAGEGFYTPTLIEKATKIHHYTVSRYLDTHFRLFIEGYNYNRIRFVRLKDPTLTFEQLMRAIEVRKQIES